MSGRIIYTPPTPTACERGRCEGKPPADEYQAGTIWQCDECDAKWKVIEGAQYNEPWSSWEKVTR